MDRCLYGQEGSEYGMVVMCAKEAELVEVLSCDMVIVCKCVQVSSIQYIIMKNLMGHSA